MSFLGLIHTRYLCTRYCDKKIKRYGVKKIKRYGVKKIKRYCDKKIILSNGFHDLPR